jgi:hypothetical protein
MHRVDFYVVLRKLIAKLQALSKSIQETPMVRFYSSIYADDEMLIRQMSGGSAFHGIPHPNRCGLSNEMIRWQRPIGEKHSLILVRNSLFLAQRHDF